MYVAQTGFLKRFAKCLFGETALPRHGNITNINEHLDVGQLQRCNEIFDACAFIADS